MGFSTMTFMAKILSWRFRHLNIVCCLLKRRPTKGGGGALPNAFQNSLLCHYLWMMSLQQGPIKSQLLKQYTQQYLMHIPDFFEKLTVTAIAG